ncbi:hypothetical protein EMIT0P228_20089 [Pseudomonas brassicacearum]
MRPYLRMRQNPLACALCPWPLSFTCHCPSVVGFSSPEGVSKVHKYHSVRAFYACT